MSYQTHNFDPVPKKVYHLYQNRLDQFLSTGQYKSHNLVPALDRGRVGIADEHVKLEVNPIGNNQRPPFAVGSKGPFRPASLGEQIGPSWATHWFRVTIKVPESWPRHDKIYFFWDIGNEGLVFLEDGTTHVAFSYERKEFILPDSFKDGKEHVFYIETASNSMFGNADPNDNIQPPTDDRYYTLKAAELVWPRVDAHKLYYDFLVIQECAKNLPENTWQKYRALDVANEIMNTFDESNVDESIKKCLQIAATFNGDKVHSTDVFKPKPNPKGLVTAVGHCHIDTAWLWPYAETRRKIGRSWTTQLDLLERYPEYTFVCSQSIQYQWLKEDYPEVFERLKKAVAAGRFTPIGGSHVESDGNIPSGESIARQFLFGQRFFESQFGSQSKTYWLPDTFGYSAQLPQLCRLANMDRFVTQKLSWNNINVFPNTTFNWVALDGSQVLCHMPPCDTYTGRCSLNEIMKCVTNHKNRDVTDTSLLVYGHGDGGGGPTVEHLERLRRFRGIADTSGGIPQIAASGNVDTFFDQLIADTDNGKKLVSWVGELYFEFHRGTYTTQAKTKKYNRYIEVMLHDIEYLATELSLRVPTYQYPTQELDRIWSVLLLNQFHDVLPGSCIEMVYDDVDALSKEVLTIGEGIFNKIFETLGLTSRAAGVSVINTMPWDRKEVIEVDQKLVSALSSDDSIQASSNGSYVIVEQTANGISDLSTSVVKSGSSLPLCHVSEGPEKGTFVLENSNVRVTIEKGLITSLYDIINDREVLAQGETASKYVIFDDEPLNWQGWDTEVYSLNKVRYLEEGKVSIYEKGPLKTSVLVEQKISDKSWIKTIISIDAVSTVNKVDFHAEVEWHEACKFLKVEYPVDVHSDFGSYDSMYGTVRRPTHYNTYWDVAKFEVCTHKYADLSDYTYGVSVLNESKYGFAIHGNTMRLSLLRAPKAPDGNADMGHHDIRWAVVPHKGGLNADTVQAAYNFNYPLKLVNGGSLNVKLGGITFEGMPNVIIGAIKRAEDDSDVTRGDLKSKTRAKGVRSVVVRLYESLGGRSRGSLVVSNGLSIKKAYKCNILEEDLEEVQVVQKGDESVVPISIGAFEIASYRLEL